MPVWIVVAVCGVFGVLARYGLDRALQFGSGTSPFVTMGINLVGCFLAGIVFTLGQREILSSELQIGLLVGFCGGFTTFSAYALHSMRLLEMGFIRPAVLSFVLSPIFGFIAVAAGMAAARAR